MFNNPVISTRELMDFSFVPIHMIGDGVELIYAPHLDMEYQFDGNYHRFKTGDSGQCPTCFGRQTFRPYPFWMAVTEKDKREGNGIMVGFWTVCRCKYEKDRQEYQEKCETKKQYAKHEKGEQKDIPY